MRLQVAFEIFNPIFRYLWHHLVIKAARGLAGTVYLFIIHVKYAAKEQQCKMSLIC